MISRLKEGIIFFYFLFQIYLSQGRIGEREWLWILKKIWKLHFFLREFPYGREKKKFPSS